MRFPGRTPFYTHLPLILLGLASPHLTSFPNLGDVFQMFLENPPSRRRRRRRRKGEGEREGDGEEEKEEERRGWRRRRRKRT